MGWGRGSLPVSGDGAENFPAGAGLWAFHSEYIISFEPFYLASVAALQKSKLRLGPQVTMLWNSDEKNCGPTSGTSVRSVTWLGGV